MNDANTHAKNIAKNIVKNIVKSDISTSILEVNLSNLKHNYQVIKEYIGDVVAGAVVKCNAYGLGVQKVAMALYEEGCRDFFIATVDEGVELKDFFEQLDITDIRIFLLNGVMPEMIKICKEKKITPVCASWKQVKECVEEGIEFFLHIETGLARLGVCIDELLLDTNQEYMKYCKGQYCKGILSQLVFADEKDNKVSRSQYEKMKQVKQMYPNLLVTTCNSGGLSHDKECFFDMVRIGRMMYGTCDTRFPAAKRILPVVKWKMQIMQVRNVKAGEGVGYGHTFIAEKDMKVAIIGAGYGDGVPIGASMRGAWCKSVKCGKLSEESKLFFIGRIGMDLCALDLSADTNLEEGDWVEFLNDENTVDVMSGVLSLNPRFLLTNVGVRVKRIYNS